MRTTRRLSLFAAAVSAVAVLTVPSTAAAAPASPSAGHRTHLLASGLQGTVGSTVGPDGALYVAESVAGRISRVDPRTGHITTFATGLPERIGDLGGAMDLVFVHRTPYVLTLTGEIWRIDRLSRQPAEHR